MCYEPDEYITWYPLLLQYQECDKVVSEYKELMEKARLKAEQEEKERKGAIKVSFLHVCRTSTFRPTTHAPRHSCFCVHVCIHTYVCTFLHVLKCVHKNVHAHVRM